MGETCNFCGRVRAPDTILIQGETASICGPCTHEVLALLEDEEAFRKLAAPKNRMQRAVETFMHSMEQVVGDSPAIREGALRRRLIVEEAGETDAAIAAGDLAGAIDGLCDLLYVVFGTAVSFGIDLQRFFDIVHASNMAKLGPDGRPRKDAGGKVQKPAGWQKPDILGELTRQRRAATHVR